MSGITDDERYFRYRYIVKALVETKEHLIHQRTLADIASRHSDVPVTLDWVRRHWTTITRAVHDDFPELWVFRPQYPWGHWVAATEQASYAEATLYLRYRQAAGQIRNDLNDGNLRALAMVNPDMAFLMRKYEAFLDKADEMDREFSSILASLVALPPATPTMTDRL